MTNEKSMKGRNFQRSDVPEMGVPGYSAEPGTPVAKPEGDAAAAPELATREA